MGTSRLLEYLPKIILPAIGATLRMLFISMSISIVLGFFIGIILALTENNGLSPNRTIYSILNFIINTIRSFPIIILIVAMAPLTRLLVGTSVGEKAAIVPLTISATPIVARMIENIFNEVDKDIIVAAKSFGMTNLQIVFKVMLVESIPAIKIGRAS